MLLPHVGYVTNAFDETRQTPWIKKKKLCFMPRLHLPRSSYDLFVYDFLFDFFGIVGAYKLRRMCLHCLRSPHDFFRRQTRTNHTETLRISYDNHKVIVQSSCYLHDLSIKSHDARTMTLRKSQGVATLTVLL